MERGDDDEIGMKRWSAAVIDKADEIHVGAMQHRELQDHYVSPLRELLKTGEGVVMV